MGRDKWIIFVSEVVGGLFIFLALVSVQVRDTLPDDAANGGTVTPVGERDKQIYRNSWFSLIVMAFFSAGAYLLGGGYRYTSLGSEQEIESETDDSWIRAYPWRDSSFCYSFTVRITI